MTTGQSSPQPLHNLGLLAKCVWLMHPLVSPCTSHLNLAWIANTLMNPACTQGELVDVEPIGEQGGWSLLTQCVFIDKTKDCTVFTTDVIPVEALPQPISFHKDDRRRPAAWGELFRAFVLHDPSASVSAADIEAQGRDSGGQSTPRTFYGAKTGPPGEPDWAVGTESLLSQLGHLSCLMEKEGSGLSAGDPFPEGRDPGHCQQGSRPVSNLWPIEVLLNGKLNHIKFAIAELERRGLGFGRFTSDGPYPIFEQSRRETSLGGLTAKEQLIGDHIVIGGVTFRSKMELKAWMAAKNIQDLELFICFADPSRLNWISPAKHQHLPFSSDIWEGLRKVGNRDSRILTYLKTAEAWYDGSEYTTGLKNEAIQRVDEIKTVLTDFQMSEKMSLTRHYVATECVTQSSTRFINKVAMRWELDINPSSQAHGMVCGLFHRLKLANEFVKEKFKGHSVLSHVLNLHLQDQAVMKEDYDSMIQELKAQNERREQEAEVVVNSKAMDASREGRAQHWFKAVGLCVWTTCGCNRDYAWYSGLPRGGSAPRGRTQENLHVDGTFKVRWVTQLGELDVTQRLLYGPYAMGSKPPPYNSVQESVMAKMVIMGGLPKGTQELLQCCERYRKGVEKLVTQERREKTQQRIRYDATEMPTCRHNAQTLAKKNYKDLEVERLKRYQQQNGKHTLQDDDNKESKKEEQRWKEQECYMIETLGKDDKDYKFYIKYMQSLPK
eukprot:jgi/Psemu1/4666/gm1.4666_g